MLQSLAIDESTGVILSSIVRRTIRSLVTGDSGWAEKLACVTHDRGTVFAGDDQWSCAMPLHGLQISIVGLVLR